MCTGHFVRYPLPPVTCLRHVAQRCAVHKTTFPLLLPSFLLPSTTTCKTTSATILCCTQLPSTIVDSPSAAQKVKTSLFFLLFAFSLDHQKFSTQQRSTQAFLLSIPTPPNQHQTQHEGDSLRGRGSSSDHPCNWSVPFAPQAIHGERLLTFSAQADGGSIWAHGTDSMGISDDSGCAQNDVAYWLDGS
jgi:hypothetical protein